MTSLPTRLFLAGLLCAITQPLAAQGSRVHGRVIVAENDAAVTGARLLLQDGEGRVKARALTDSTGAFELTGLVPGSYHLYVLSTVPPAAQSHPVTVYNADDIQLEIRLAVDALPLDPINVEATARSTERVRDFRERAALNKPMGVGRIYTRADIEAMQPRTAEVLWAAIPKARCNPEIRLDGMPATVADLRNMTPQNLEGAEIYMGTDVPREFEYPGACGVALFWTRTRPEGMREMGFGRLLVAGLFAAATFFFVR